MSKHTAFTPPSYIHWHLESIETSPPLSLDKWPTDEASFFFPISQYRAHFSSKSSLDISVIVELGVLSEATIIRIRNGKTTQS